MPEFILDHGDTEHFKLFHSLDSFTQGYIEAAFFTSTGDLVAWHGDESLETATTAEIAPTALAAIVADCERWQKEHADTLQEAYETETGYDAHRAGNDYWYTRNGHGTGFWDRDLGETGDMLANACRYHEVNLVRGDDGLIYFD